MPLAFPAAATVKFLTNYMGLYLHVPFCEKKCRYCDFYSGFPTDELLDSYTEALIKSIKLWGGKFHRPIDTIYLGGGTPSLLNYRLVEVIAAVKESFAVAENAEITLELNPKGDASEVLTNARRAGVNRLSIGMQSGIDSELELLGRKHTFADTVNTVKTARALGFSNISLDLMIGLPDSNEATLTESLKKITALEPEHISAYILKIEENTAFYKAENLNLPCDDAVADQYLLMCDYFKSKGYSHYEISNFSKDGRASRHNLKYWLGVDYLGIGPSAHSAVEGKRFYYKRDIKGFINGDTPVPDGESGGKEEFIMLRLRLKEGINGSEYKQLFGEDLPKSFVEKARLFEKNGLMNIENNSYSLTDKGMLISNSIITEVLDL